MRHKNRKLQRGLKKCDTFSDSHVNKIQKNSLENSTEPLDGSGSLKSSQKRNNYKGSKKFATFSDSYVKLIIKTEKNFEKILLTSPKGPRAQKEPKTWKLRRVEKVWNGFLFMKNWVKNLTNSTKSTRRSKWYKRGLVTQIIFNREIDS